MKKLKLFALSLFAAFSMGAWAETIFSYALTAPGADGTTYDAVGGSAKCLKAMASGGSNEVTIEGQTFYKFNSSSAWEFTLANEGTFAVGDVLSFTCACTANKNGKGVKINNSISVTGDFSANTPAVISYTVVADDGVAGASSFSLYRADSDIKFGIVDVTRDGGSTPPSPSCTEADATFAAASTAIAIAADATNATTNLTFTKGNNTSDAVYTVLKGGKATSDAAVANGVFTATAAGTYVVKATQAADGTYCEVVKEVTITVTDNRPAPAEFFHWQYDGATVKKDSVLAATGGTVTLKSTDASKNWGTESIAYNASVEDDMKSTGNKGLKSGGNALYIEVALDQNVEEGDVIYICGYNGWKVSSTLDMSGDVAADVTTGTSKTDYQVGSVTVPAGINTNKLYLSRAAGTGTCISAIKIARVADDGTPKLGVSPASVDLNVTAEYPAVNAKVTFSGKNLAAGTYSLTVPNLSGLSVNPTSVTVGNDGKLNAEVTIAYTSNVAVEAGATEVGLTIGTLNAKVAVNYSAVVAKVYAQSINIEQLVLDNGIHYAIADELTAKGYTYANLNALDSLNDSKTARNEPFLGLKIKTSGGYIKMLLHANDVLRVKFGNLPAAVKVTFNDANEVQHSEGVYEYTATEEVYVKIATSTSGTVVFKQIMINEAIADVTLPASPEPTALDAVETGKAVKFIENGQIYIIRDGVRYNALGAVVE